MAWDTIELRDANDAAYYQPADSATGELNLGNAYDGAVSSYMLHLNVNGATVSIVLKGRARRAEAANAPLVSLPYQKIDAATIDIAAGTAITDSGIYYVRCDGLDLIVDLDSNDGQPILYAQRLLG